MSKETFDQMLARVQAKRTAASGPKPAAPKAAAPPPPPPKLGKL